MKRIYLLKKNIYAVLFLLVLFGFSGLNLMHSYPLVKESMEEMEHPQIADLESSLTDNLLGKMNFIESYGFVQVLLDKRESNNFSYIKDEEGFLHYAAFFREEDDRMFEYATRVERLKDYVEPKGTKVMFVVPPGKYDPAWTKFRTGMPVNDPSANVDELLFYLNRLGVECLDLRQSMPNATLSYEETFFKTDHHWTIPAAFCATQELVRAIEERFGENLDPEGYYMDLSNYDKVTYRSGMLGSMGRRTGAAFCGIEDFTALWPKYEGRFTRECMAESGRTVKEKGNFVKALMDTKVLTEKTDIYSDSQYSLYLNGLRIYEKIQNEENPDGAKILMIRDSYFSPVMAFMMPMCGEMDAIWSLEETEVLDIESYVKEHDFDYIIVEVYPYNINSKAFNFFKEGE